MWTVISFLDVGKCKTNQFIIIYFEKGSLLKMNLVLEMLSFRYLRDFFIYSFNKCMVDSLHDD